MAVLHQWFVLGPHDFVNIVEAESLAGDRGGLHCARSTRERAHLQSAEMPEVDDPSSFSVGDPPRLPNWLAAEVASWPQDAWGAHQTRLLLRDGAVLEPVAALLSGDVVGWGKAGSVDFEADDIVAIERIGRVTFQSVKT